MCMDNEAATILVLTMLRYSEHSSVSLLSMYRVFVSIPANTLNHNNLVNAKLTQYLPHSTFWLPWRDPLGNRHQNATCSVWDRPPSLCKISAKSVQQFRTRCILKDTLTDKLHYHTGDNKQQICIMVTRFNYHNTGWLIKNVLNFAMMLYCSKTESKQKESTL